MRRIAFFCLVGLLFTSCGRKNEGVSMDQLLKEMYDLKRLASLPEIPYTNLQFSSFDRRSKNPGDSLWFANEDGFGAEPLPGFLKVLLAPDSTGRGEYLMAAVSGPGVIQRLWTAAMTGKIRVYLDDMRSPYFEGDANTFFRFPLANQPGLIDSLEFEKYFRQYDAVYLPIPFSLGCRIEWIGNIREPHFYHIGVRRYPAKTRIEPFDPEILTDLVRSNKKSMESLLHPEESDPGRGKLSVREHLLLDPGRSMELYDLSGEKAITFLQLKMHGIISETALRKTLVKIRFDAAPQPQVVAPAGDFFGAAPGINPYQSLPLAVQADSFMICRFVMPFRQHATIELENLSDESINVSAGLAAVPWQWEDGRSMHFHTNWHIDYDLVTGEMDSQCRDIPYIVQTGKGRIAGVAAYLYNPSNAVTSWGNWWGEGDEKIYIDRDTFPSFFGTGSEDYFNYSWSAREVFSFPYCGQPRNDGPGNRGYVSNFRWHVADDIYFNEKIAFYMELRHHGVVKGFSYARMVYYYALPEAEGNSAKPDDSTIRPVTYTNWSPVAFKGSAGWDFIQAEDLITARNKCVVAEDEICAGMKVLEWTPSGAEGELYLVIPSNKEVQKTRIGLTIEHSPEGSKLCFLWNDIPVRVDGRDTLYCRSVTGRKLETHFTDEIDLRKGRNKLTVKMPECSGRQVGRFDFIWIRE
ncbi:MAG: glycoside hydrolase family 172 protein [Bacteroidales bacterium]